MGAQCPALADLLAIGAEPTALVASPVVSVVEIAMATKLLAEPQVTVLDVRTPEKYALGHLQRSQNLNFSAVDFGQQFSKLDPKGRYVLYCGSGNRISKAAALMQQQGIANVINAGGYAALRAAGNK